MARLADGERLVDGVFTKDELRVIYEFCDNGNRRASYRKIFGDGKKAKTDPQIYKWFKKPEVQAKIIEIGSDLSIYDTVADKTLLSIITSTMATDKDKVSAIKVWNDLRKRVHQTIKVEAATTIDFSNVTDENLEAIVKKIMEVEDECSTD